MTTLFFVMCQPLAFWTMDTNLRLNFRMNFEDSKENSAKQN